jgi:membrane-associated PAP2 superfamily phosphatase
MKRFFRVALVALSMLVAVIVVGALKATTNIDCPWDLAGFGGHNPVLPLLAPRPAYLPHARCFPGAHSASGFALACLYFAWRDGSPRRARWGLAAGILIGTLFAIGQEARGAHFLSHDLASAAVVWFVQLGLYVAWCKRRGASVRRLAAPDAGMREDQAGGAACAADLRPSNQRMPPTTIMEIRMPVPTPAPQLSTQLTSMNSMLM